MRESGKNAGGQAMVLFLGFTAAIIGIMLVSFNSGQVTNAKMRAMNAADAAAYSGAVWQARTLNFQAYMNRAIIVNEVTIAQSVSLRSWIDYLAEFTKNAAMIDSVNPGVEQALAVVKGDIDAIQSSAQGTLPAAEYVLRELSVIESNAEGTINSAGFAIAKELAQKIAEQNGANITPGAESLFGGDKAKWDGFTLGRSQGPLPDGTPGDGRDRLREVALASRDEFTRARDWVQANKDGSSVRKQGGTDLVDYDSWVALDSSSLCASTNCATPLGWGGAQAYFSEKKTNIGIHGDTNKWDDPDGVKARAAASTAAAARALNSAFPGYRDVGTLAITAKQKLPFAVEVVIKGASIPTAGSALKAKAALNDSTGIEHDPHYQGAQGGTYALAEACVAFERPHGAPLPGGAKEFPSLFNPYWRASLATDDFRSREAVDAYKGLASMGTSISGVGSCR
jgi:hypothetical protein